MDKGAWQDTVHGVPKSWTQLSDNHLIAHSLRSYNYSTLPLKQKAALDKTCKWLWPCSNNIFLDTEI